MIFQEKLITRMNYLQSYLCIGLDPEFEKLPDFIRKKREPLFEFCREIIDFTHNFTIAYKINIAFFERFGSKGFVQFEKVISYIKENVPQVLTIVDAKRGDLANTSKEYSKYYFENLKIDSLTINPYMGKDSFEPYLLKGGHIFALCLTSNPGSYDLQYLKLNSGKELYLKIAEYFKGLEKSFVGQIGLVVGGTHSNEIKFIREVAPNLCFLIPGYGSQGAKLEDILPVSGGFCLVSSSRGILFGSEGKDFAKVAGEKAKSIMFEMKKFYKEIHI